MRGCVQQPRRGAPCPGRPRRGVADFEAALGLEPRSREAWNNRGTVRHAQGDYAGALADFDRALQIDPCYGAAYHNRGLTRHAQRDYAAAIADFNLALSYTSPRSAARLVHDRGATRLAQGDLGGALTDFDAALKLDPQSCVACISRGNARYHKRDPGAILDYRKAFTLDPWLAAQTVVRILADDLERDAAHVFANCASHLRDNPDDASAYCRRGLSHLLLGRDAEAEADFQEFLARPSPTAQHNLTLLIQAARQRCASLAHKP